eukprot:COSAG04_NODE_2161_length_4653_cov_10.099473_6_plen_109_part_00
MRPRLDSKTCAGMVAQRCVWLGRDLAELLRPHHQVKKRQKGAEARGECSHHAREGIVHTLQSCAHSGSGLTTEGLGVWRAGCGGTPSLTLGPACAARRNRIGTARARP